MYTKFLSYFRKNLRVFMLTTMCVVGSFALGIQSAGEVQPIALIEAGNVELPGDIDGSGVLDIHDAILILEVAQGYKKVSPEQLRADPNGNGVLTVDDALSVLSQLINR